jgi:mannose-6-phosphate isomerase-like protein (cupin superfamily)
MPVIEEVNNALGGNNDAGLKRNYYFGLAADVAVWPTQEAAPATYAEKTTQTAAVEMATGKRMWPVQMTVNSDNGLKSESAGSVGSLSAKNSLRGKNARINAEMCGWLEEHKNDELFFIVEGNNGQLMFFGSENVPAMFASFNVDHGGKVDDEKMISFELDNFGRLPMFYGTIAAPLAIPLTPAV